MKYASIHRPNPEYKKASIQALKDSRSEKSLSKPKRMYFKPKSNLERVVDELKSRHVDITEYEPIKAKKLHQINKFQPRKAWGSTSALNPPDQNSSDKDSESSKEEEYIPKQIFAGLHNKTYFKGVTSLILGLDSKTRIKNNIDVSAEEVLTNCNVRIKSKSQYLKIGQGKLVSNPEESVRETYEKLKDSLKSN